MMSPAPRLLVLLAALATGCDSGVTGGDGRIYPGGKHFGRSVALDGDIALVGADDSDEAFVLSDIGGAWRVDARLQPAGYPDRGSGGSETNNVLYGWDVGLDGDVAVVGAPILASGREAEPSRAFIYERRSGVWVEAAELRPPVPTPGAQLGIFGLTVAASNGRVAVGMKANSTPISGEAIDPAAILIYERVGDRWTETARVEETVLSREGRSSGYGRGMDLDGDRLVVSSAQWTDGPKYTGVVSVYERSGATWPLTATLAAPAPHESGPIGSVLALDGPLLAAVSLTREVEGEVGSGSVFVFRESGGAWAYEAELRPPDLGFLDSYGYAVAADSGPAGDRVAVSAAGRAQTRGSVFVWVRRPSGAWELEAELWPEGRGSGTSFGEGVALDGDRLLAGAIAVGSYEGAVYEFRRGPDGWAQVRD